MKNESSPPTNGTPAITADPVKPDYNRAASDIEPAAKAPEPKLDQEPPRQKADYPEPGPGGLSSSAKADIVAQRLEKAKKRDKEIGKKKQLTKSFEKTIKR